MNFTFTIPGKPQGKARPRFTGKHTYTPPKTAAYEELVRSCYRKQGGGCFPKGAPLYVAISAAFAVPTSDSKRERQAKLRGEMLPTKRPDWDNIGKIVCDALNGVAWHDDAQIVSACVEKIYDTASYVQVEIGI